MLLWVYRCTVLVVPQGGPARLSSVWWVVFEAASDSATHCGGRSGEELCTGRQGRREGLGDGGNNWFYKCKVRGAVWKCVLECWNVVYATLTSRDLIGGGKTKQKCSNFNLIILEFWFCQKCLYCIKSILKRRRRKLNLAHFNENIPFSAFV